MNYGIVSVLCGIAIVAIGAGALYVSYKKSENNKEKAKEFIEGLSDKILSLSISIINSFKSEYTYKTIDEFEISVLNKIYNDTFDYVKQEAEKAFEKDLLAKAIISSIDKEDVVNLVNNLINKKNLENLILAKFAPEQKEVEAIEEEDKAIEEQFSDQDSYVENVETVEPEPAKEIIPTEEELKKLNPQKEDEDDNINIEDDSVEIIVDKPEIISTQDKNGNELYYEVDKDGRKKRVSKKYALEQLNK